MRLGRKPHDPQAVARAPQLHAHRFAAVQVPSKLDRSSLDFAPGLYQNDTLPDCTAVALVNSARAVAATYGYSLFVRPDLVPAFYGETLGKPAATTAELAATDGAVMLDVLKYQAQRGCIVGQQTPLVALFGVLPLDRISLARAMYRFGHAYIGVTLYDADMLDPPIWDVTAADGNVVGGHAVMLWDYAGLGDRDLVRIGTWGKLQQATWSWVEHRMDEAYALIWRQLGPADGSVDIALLEQQLQSSTA